MKRTLWIALFSIALSLEISFAGVLGPRERATSLRIQKSEVQDWKYLDVNTINCTISSYGQYADCLKSFSSGLEWPKGSGKTAVFTAGIWVIGRHQPSGLLRTAVQNYATEFRPGRIVTQFNTSTNDRSAADDPSKLIYHVYKISKKDTVGGTNPDYDQWPSYLGAPCGPNGKPLVLGDQQLWCVYNDADTAGHNKLGFTLPMGIEVQVNYFGFDSAGALGNTMFVQWKIINKSDASYDSVFVSLWSDTDLGDAADDMVGVDTLRNLAFAYNADNDDGTFHGYGSTPPADGFVLLYGPMVQSGKSDSAMTESG